MRSTRKKPGRIMDRPARKKTVRKKEASRVKVRALALRSWWALRGIAAGFLVLTLLYAGYLGLEKAILFPSLAVRTIEVEGCRAVDPDSLVQRSGMRVGEPLLKVDLKKVRARLITHPVLKDASVVRELPGTLRILVQERTPAAALMNREFALVDMEGVVLSRQVPYTGNYPIITGVKQIPEEGKVAPEAVAALEVMKDIILSGFPDGGRISELSIAPDRFLVSLTGSGTLLILPRRNVPEAMGRLHRFVESGHFDIQAPGYDLRFKGRVIALPERNVARGTPRGAPFAGGKSHG
jgi:cell division septal protein FtsQ